MSAISKVTVVTALITSGAILQARPVPVTTPAAPQAPKVGVALGFASTAEDPVRITHVGHTEEHGGYTSVSLLNQTDRAVRAVVFAVSIGQGAGPTVKLSPLRSVRFELDLPARTLRTVEPRLIPESELTRIVREAQGVATLELSIANIEYAATNVEATIDTRAARGGGAGQSRGANDGPRREPVLLTVTHPKYTPEAMRQKIQGVVELELDIDETGRVAAARVVRSLDSTYGLDDQAITAALATRFSPATEGGHPVGTTVRYQMEFKLH